MTVCCCCVSLQSPQHTSSTLCLSFAIISPLNQFVSPLSHNFTSSMSHTSRKRPNPLASQIKLRVHFKDPVAEDIQSSTTEANWNLLEGISFPHTEELNTTLLRMERSLDFLENSSENGREVLKSRNLRNAHRMEHVFVEIKPKSHTKQLNYSSVFPPVVYEQEHYVLRVTYAERHYILHKEKEKCMQFNFFAPQRDMMHVRHLRSGKDTQWPVKMFALNTELYEVRFKKPSTLYDDATQICLCDGSGVIWSSNQFQIHERSLDMFGQLEVFWHRFKKADSGVKENKVDLEDEIVVSRSLKVHSAPSVSRKVCRKQRVGSAALAARLTL